MKLTDEMTVVLGEFCERVMVDDLFAALTQLFDAKCYEEMVTTAEHETKRREAIYSRQRGVKDFLALMAGLVSEKNRLTAPSEQDAQKEGFDD